MDALEERLKQMTPLQKAMVALKETQARLAALERRQAEPIAIVGMGCRFPGGVETPDDYWRLLCDRKDAVREVPPDRWDVDRYYDPDSSAPGKMNTRWGGFVDRIGEFDNHFFRISDREASLIDPMYRMLLEVAWEACEDAGLPPSRLRGSRTGVFVGLSHSDYGILLSSDLACSDAFVCTGTSHCTSANRISFLFGFCGPSLSLDSACSSSLLSVHLACQSLRTGDADLALAAGASLILSPSGTINQTKAGFSAPDGRVRAFDAKASGYVRGEGVGILVLKPLAAALRDGDRIHAVIRGSAVNQNGASNGLTAPSGQAQERVLREAYARAGVSPGQIDYVETQGTGTPLGDTIEALTLGKVMAEGRPDGRPCAIGSVKTNLGHLEAASGIASLIKTTLALKHRELPPSLHFEEPNPSIPFAELPLRVQTEQAPWPSSSESRLAGVSAFGFGGSNAHVVLSEAPEPPPPYAGACPGLLALSARTDSALRDLVSRYLGLLRDAPPPWAEVCATAATRRDHHDCRLVALAATPAAAAECLADFLGGRERSALLVGRRPWERGLQTAFVFTGDLAPWRSVAVELGCTVPGLAECVAALDGPLATAGGPAAERVSSDLTVWDRPESAWPALVAVQLALVEWLRGVGVRPQAVVGSGIGELAAAVVAGVLETGEALRLAVALARGPSPAMTAGLSHREAQLPFVSIGDGRLCRGLDLAPQHWLRILDSDGGADAARLALAECQADVWLHLGNMTLDCPGGTARAMPGSDGRGMLEALAALYAAGTDIDWSRVFPAGIAPVQLPTYPWQRQYLWAARKTWLEVGAAPAPREVVREASFVESVSGEPMRPRPDMVVPYVAPTTMLERELAATWGEVLRIEGVGLHDNFFELGGDSLQAMMLHNRLQEKLGEVVQGYVLFEVQTIGDLVDYLRGHFADTVQRLYPDEESAAPIDSAAAVPAVGESVPLVAPGGGNEAEELLGRLDDLSDDEVAALLQAQLEDEESNV